MGFLVGFLLPAPVAWDHLQVGFDSGQVSRGVANAIGALVLGAFAGGGAGLAIGTFVGWVWERLHRQRRFSRAKAAPAEIPGGPRSVAMSGAGAAAGTASVVGRRDAARTTRPAGASTIRFDDAGLTPEAFISLADRVWPREYDLASTTAALQRTINIGAWDGGTLVGAVRVLTDGYFFATVPEILVDPAYQRRGIGRELMTRALDEAPRGKIWFGAQPQSVGFFEKLGCERSLTGFVMRQNAGAPAHAPVRSG